MAMKIIAAAIQYKGVNFIRMPPQRHSDIIHVLSEINEDAAINGVQGFLTNEGIFVGRVGAKAIVKDFNQPTIRDTHPTELFSEDLW